MECEPILFDDAHSKGITYTQFDEMTGKVYAWLKEQGIGKEDFVLINLPRGVFPIVAMVGVWKAGAAWALVEDTYAPERIAYIRKDCGCTAELNKDNWDIVMHTKPLAGFVMSDPHDAAYAIYTSGTTGNPKGVLHEYGNLERAIESIKLNGETPFNSKDRLALLAPLNFVASVIVILKCLSIPCGRNYVVPYAVIKNPMMLMKFFLEKRITITFLTPSYVRKLGNKSGPFLRMLIVGSEPANNIYNKNVQLVNVYAASESGFAVGIGFWMRTEMKCRTERRESSALRIRMSAGTLIFRRKRRKPSRTVFITPATLHGRMPTETMSCWEEAAI